ncbi:MAG: hypothetical protein J6C85_04640 [Alphaproteobacteria bacterium]|nr:hypothetical protein [Alphaproteobacteria bacterium]
MKKYYFDKVAFACHLSKCDGYAANAFLMSDGKKKMLEGYVFDNKYFIEEKSEKIYDVKDFYLINNVEDFED